MTSHPGPAPVGSSPDVSRSPSPDVLGLRDFCKTDVQAQSSLIPDAPAGPNDPRNTSTTSTNGEATLLRKSTLRCLQHRRKVISQPDNEDTDLEKLKSLQNRVIPREEKAMLELESALQKYSQIADPMDFGVVTDQVDPVIEEASNFITTVTSLYDDNEGYALGLSGLEKSITEIKPFSAGSDITIFKFLDNFNTYSTGYKKAKGYKLYNNYLSTSIQAQTNLFQQDFDGLVNYLKVNYGRIEVISNGLLRELEKKKKPGDNDFLERAESMLAIKNIILRLQNLKNKLPEEQVMTEITS